MYDLPNFNILVNEIAVLFTWRLFEQLLEGIEYCHADRFNSEWRGKKEAKWML